MKKFLKILPLISRLTSFFGGNGGAKINKFLDCVKSIVIGRNPRINILPVDNGK